MHIHKHIRLIISKLDKDKHKTKHLHHFLSRTFLCLIK